MTEMNSNTANSNDTRQTLLADIEIARTDLYVFRESKEKEKWEKLLDRAEKEVANDNYVHAQKLIERVQAVIGKLWSRIFRWHNTQKLVTLVFAIAIPAELIAIALYTYFIDISTYEMYTSMLFGLLGGSLGVALNIGQELEIGQSNRLQMLRLLMRPFIGVISAIVLYLLLQTKLLVVAPSADQTGILILLSIFAGFSERFIVKAMSNYMPLLNGKG